MHCSINYYNFLPVYGTPRKGYSIDEIVDILLGPNFDCRLLCKTNPISVENNVSFVIDRTSLSNPNDVRADDLGAWKCTGSRSLRFLVKLDGKSCTIVNSRSTSKNVVVIVVYIRRQYHVHGTDCDLHRMIAFMESFEGKSIQDMDSTLYTASDFMPYY